MDRKILKLKQLLNEFETHAGKQGVLRYNQNKQ
jgi:hypothetical protein